MSLRERIYARTDRPMSWTKAILLGTLIWIVGILLLGQLPSIIIYWNDQNIASIIEFTQKIPGVGEAGLNTTQINMIRDIVANAVQMGILTAMLVAAYFWQERKRKRTGAKGLQDTVKGYMSGK
jgi:asparagine N-glycosylation enzyme membrane subunit Stt3